MIDSWILLVLLVLFRATIKRQTGHVMTQHQIQKNVTVGIQI